MKVPWERSLFPLPSAMAVLGLPSVNGGGKIREGKTSSLQEIWLREAQ